jgi:hypothetical protein
LTQSTDRFIDIHNPAKKLKGYGTMQKNVPRLTLKHLACFFDGSRNLTEEVKKEIPGRTFEHMNLNLKTSLLDYWEVRFVLFGVTVGQLSTRNKILAAGVRRDGILLCRPYVPWKSSLCA